MNSTWRGEQHHDTASGSRTCDECGAIILTLGGVVLDAGGPALARLAGFGLGSAGQPLLERKRKEA